MRQLPMEEAVMGPPEREDEWGNLTPPANQAVVLVADDHDDFRATVAFHLAMAGYPVVEASSVAGVVARSRAVHPDLVIVSDQLGARPVADILAMLAGQPDLVDVPVITLSSEARADRLVESLSHGARDHVCRADGVEALLARIDAVLRADEQLERLRRRNAELEFLGAVDPVTGMANRRNLEEELDRLAAGAARHKLPLSVVLASVDDPPGGDEAADAVQRELAYLVASVRRTDDFAGVWDRHTFAVLLPMTALEGARAFAGRLVAAVHAAPLNCGERVVPVTLTCACTEVTGPAGMVFRQLGLGVLAGRASGQSIYS